MTSEMPDHGPDQGRTTGPPSAERLSDKTARVGVIGLGYVGLPLAVTAAKAGFPVTGFDVDASKMERLDAAKAISRRCRMPISPRCGALRLDHRFRGSGGVRRHRHLRPHAPDPAARAGSVLSSSSTAETIAAHLSPGTLVALESTTWPGTTQEVLCPILETSGLRSGADIFVGFSPEREDPGNATYRTKTIPKIVAGEGETAGDLMEASTAPWSRPPCVCPTPPRPRP
jgi:UDP-N-acetyl-D-glucosamine dehydrogenase